MRRTWLSLILVLSLIFCIFGSAEETQSEQTEAAETDIQTNLEEKPVELTATQDEKEEVEPETEGTLPEETVLVEAPEYTESDEENQVIIQENSPDEDIDEIAIQTESDENASNEAETINNQDEEQTDISWDGELILGKREKVSFDKETESKVYHLKINRSMDVVVQTEDGLSVSLTITTLEGSFIDEIRPAFENGKGLPIEEKLHLKWGEYARST